LATLSKSEAVKTAAVGALHERLVLNRRVRVLARWFNELLPRNARVLDVGCGDGELSALIRQNRSDLTIQGIDVLARAQTRIPVQIFDGLHFPFDDAEFDVVMFSDVLHHTVDPTVLLREAHRVTRGSILIKDHFREGLAAGARLRFMDWVGNARFGVALPYNYWTKAQWQVAWKQIGLEPEVIVTKLGLYPKPANWIFESKLHFFARLKRTQAEV
jgi:SAM-dependent methyltransferase